eukprot:1483750-Rhodomonas_salina.2
MQQQDLATGFAQLFSSELQTIAPADFILAEIHVRNVRNQGAKCNNINIPSGPGGIVDDPRPMALNTTYGAELRCS